MFLEWLETIAQRYGDKPAVICDEDTLTYSQLLEISWRCAADLAERGVQKGDRIILMAVNGIDWLVSFFGIILAGGVAALANYNLNSHDTTMITQLIDAKWAILGVDDLFGIQPEIVVQAVESGGVQPKCILPSRVLYTNAIAAKLNNAEFSAIRRLATLTKPEDTQIIIFTTGTTSFPKAVQLSSKGLLANIFGALEICRNDLGNLSCCVLPLFHVFGLFDVIMRIENGGTVCLAREFLPEAVLKLIEKHRGVDSMAAVGTFYKRLIEQPGFEEKGKGRIKTCFWGASMLHSAEMERMQKSLGGTKILVAYGLSECSGGVSMCSSDIPLECQADTVGRPLSNLVVRVWQGKRGFLPRGEIGEIVVKGAALMNGYLGIPKEEQPIDEDGWLHTGDLGVITEDGLLQFKGRIKDLIKRAGENISPAEIEEALLEEPAISDAKVIGVSHPVLDESVEACVVLRGGELDERRLKMALRKKLSSYKIPDHIVVFSAFPLNTNGKVNKLRLKEMLVERLKEVPK